jgi:hypothetical protein
VCVKIEECQSEADDQMTDNTTDHSTYSVDYVSEKTLVCVDMLMKCCTLNNASVTNLGNILLLIFATFVLKVTCLS